MICVFNEGAHDERHRAASGAVAALSDVINPLSPSLSPRARGAESGGALTKPDSCTSYSLDLAGKQDAALTYSMWL